MIFLENEIVYGRSFPVPQAGRLRRADRQGARASSRARTSRWWRIRICVGLILEAAEKLAEEGIEAELIDLRTLRPLDTATVIASVKKTNRLVTVEQGWPICSIGSEICARWSSRRSTISTRRRPGSPARTCRCPMPPISKSSRCRRWTTSIAAAKAVCYR